MSSIHKQYSAFVTATPGDKGKQKQGKSHTPHVSVIRKAGLSMHKLGPNTSNNLFLSHPHSDKAKDPSEMIRTFVAFSL